MRNHDKEIITQNVWDNLGRVKEQYLHGDTSKTWKLRYSGVENYEEDPEGGVTTYLYDDRGRSVGKIDAEGNKSTMKYDGQDQVVERISGSGEITSFEYDSDHNLLQVNYPRGGGSVINVYDSLHRLDYTTDPESNLTDFVYFSSGFNTGKNRPQQIIDPEGTTTFTYHESGSAAGMVKTITDDDNLVTENAYDAYSQPDWTEAPGDLRTEFQYTARGELDWVEDPNGTRTDFTYNERRQVTQVVTDKNGSDEATEDRTYDNQGRVQTVEAPQDNGGLRVKQSYTYTPTDNLDVESLVNETATTADDAVVDHEYDGRDWSDSVIDAANREIEITYFANGEVDQVQRPATRTSSFIYDDDNRVLTQTNPGAPTDRVHGFAYGETLSAEGDTTEGFPRSIFTDADSLTTTTEYNRLGQPRYYRNKAEDVFEFRYDGLGRRTHAITPLDAANTRATLTTYAHRGEVNTITEPSGQTATFGYNGTTGRLESATYSDGVNSEVVNYTLYDANGNLKTLNEGADAITRTYDNLNRVKSYADINGNTIGYRYYDSGKVAKIIYPGGTENGVGHVEYTYWQTGRLKEVIDKLDSTSSPRTTTNYWNNDGRLDRIERPNGTIRKIKYDLAGRPEIVEEYTSTGQLIALYKNSYYQSDELQWVYQLPKANTSAAKPNVVSAMLYNADNQLSSFEGQLVTHDPDGNMTNGPLPDGNFGAYAFDLRNRLKSAGGVSYEYDPEGERVSQSATGETVEYVNENNLGLTKVLQRTKNGEIVRYVWGVGLLYEVNDSAEATYYHYDNYGSTTVLTDENEVVTDRIEYSPFGSITHREGTHDTPFLFTGFFGNQTDSNGLIHMRARFYNPLIRRFVNADPAQQGWNWYAYAAGNPMGFVDPTGLGNASVLNAVQTGLSFLGMVPVVGFVADIANAGISVARGNYADAAINFAAAVPGAGQAVMGAKLAGAGLGIWGAVRAADRLGDFGRGASKGTRVFWSGGKQARGAAETFAKQSGGQTLEMTKTGKFLDAITTDKTYPYLRPFWDQASKRYAKGAGSSVEVFQSGSRGVRLESVWATKEYPQLIRQGTNINYNIAP
jgi:RHS repeat-associated protein